MSYSTNLILTCCGLGGCAARQHRRRKHRHDQHAESSHPTTHGVLIVELARYSLRERQSNGASRTVTIDTTSARNPSSNVGGNQDCPESSANTDDAGGSNQTRNDRLEHAAFGRLGEEASAPDDLLAVVG